MKICPHEASLTSWLLGDLPPAEADTIRRHLADCASCRALADELRPVVAALRAGLAAAPTKPLRLLPSQRRRVLATPYRSPFRRWWSTPHPVLRLAAAIVVVAVIGLATLFPARRASISGYRAKRAMPAAELADSGIAWETAEAPYSSALVRDDKLEALNGYGKDIPDPRAFAGEKNFRAKSVEGRDDQSWRRSRFGERVTEEAPGGAGEAGSGLKAGGAIRGRVTEQTPADMAAFADVADARHKKNEAEVRPPAGSVEWRAEDRDGAQRAKSEEHDKERLAAEVAVLEERTQTLGGMLNELRASPTKPPAKPKSAPPVTAASRDELEQRRRSATETIASGERDIRQLLGRGEGMKDAEKKSGDGKRAASSSLTPEEATSERMKRVVIPEIDFRQANVNDIADFSKRAAKPFGDDENGDHEDRKLDFVVKSETAGKGTTETGARKQIDPFAPGEEKPGVASGPAPVTFEGRYVNLDDAAQIVADVSGMKLDVANSVVSLTPKYAADADGVSGEDAPLPPAPREPAAHNPFVATRENPFSTFAIDVDTASYTLTRQALTGGALPDPESVRTEEIVNYFDYGDTAPENAVFRIYIEGAPAPFGAGLDLLRIGVKGRRLGREEQRPAMLTFLVDSSGSMDQPDRIGLARQSLALLLEQLSPRDQLQLIAFDDHARLLLEATSAAAREEIMAAFNRLQCRGSTNLEEGMRQAYAHAARAFRPGAENRVILISDGVANLGSASAAEILASIDAYRRQGITCSVFGVGRGVYNDEMLEQLANRGDGAYRFLDSLEEARRAFVDDLAATLNTIATDVKIQVEWDAAVVARYRQLGYENRALTKEQFRDDTVDAGEIGSGQSVTALYEIERAASAPRRRPLGVVRVRYRRVDTRAIEEIAQPILPSQLAAAIEAARPELRLAAGAAEFAELLRRSPHAGGGRFADVVRLLHPVALEMKLDTRVAELLRLVELAGGMAE